jgi:hypothetical protein
MITRERRPASVLTVLSSNTSHMAVMNLSPVYTIALLWWNVTSYPMGTGGTFPRGKEAGALADHSPPTSAKVRNTWIYTSTPIHVFMA